MSFVPHHLVDEYSPSEAISTGVYCRKASQVVKEILSRNKVNLM